MVYESKVKPSKCPHCNSDRIAEIFYGLQAFSKILVADLNAGKIILGGCCITDDDPVWQYIKCGARIYRKID